MQSLYGAIANTNKKEIMAISINNVYQKVLALANKEQRGYITPQEFNLFAEYAQLDIFNKYFDDLRGVKSINVNSDYSDSKISIKERISAFELFNQSLTSYGLGFSNLPNNLYSLGSVTVNWDSIASIVQVQRVDTKEANKYVNTALASPTKNNPIYTQVAGGSMDLQNNGRIRIYPQPTGADSVNINYIKKPRKPNWTYVISNGNALFNATSSNKQDFDLHDSEENNLAIKILQLAGISIKDGSLVQAASQEEIKKIQQQKQ